MQDLNGDNLWNEVIKHRNAQIKQDKKQAAGGGNDQRKQVRFRGEDGAEGHGIQRSGLAQYDQIMDLKKLLEFTKGRLNFLEARSSSSSHGNPEEDASLMLNHNHFVEQRDDQFMMPDDQDDPMELKMRYSQGENDGADFKSILDANYNEMVSNGVFLG